MGVDILLGKVLRQYYETTAGFKTSEVHAINVVSWEVWYIQEIVAHRCRYIACGKTLQYGTREVCGFKLKAPPHLLVSLSAAPLSGRKSLRKSPS